jgi:hypothetical protein
LICTSVLIGPPVRAERGDGGRIVTDGSSWPEFYIDNVYHRERSANKSFKYQNQMISFATSPLPWPSAVRGAK